MLDEAPPGGRLTRLVGRVMLRSVDILVDILRKVNDMRSFIREDRQEGSEDQRIDLWCKGVCSLRKLAVCLFTQKSSFSAVKTRFNHHTPTPAETTFGPIKVTEKLQLHRNNEPSTQYKQNFQGRKYRIIKVNPFNANPATNNTHTFSTIDNSPIPILSIIILGLTMLSP